jgi:outer membrane protein assembly factor BamB
MGVSGAAGSCRGASLVYSTFVADSIGGGIARSQGEIMGESSRLYIGIRGRVLALDPATGTELWRTELKGMDFVNVVLQDGRLLATAKGEIFALDPATGKVLWNNPLKGLGTGLLTIAGAPQLPPMASQKKRQEAAAAGAAAAGAS